MFEHLTDPKEMRRQKLISLSNAENILLEDIRSPRFTECVDIEKQYTMLNYFKVMDEINRMYINN